MSDVKLKLDNISKKFNKDQMDEIVALADISMEFYAGEWVYIVGGNGSGKSTLLKVINADTKADSGVLFNNCSTSTYLLESNTLSNLVPKMTIYENLLLSTSSSPLFPRLKFFPKKERKAYFVEILSQFKLGLENRLHEQVLNLSSGHQQAIAITKVFIAQRKIVLLDEFTSALDKKTAPIIFEALKKYKDENNATIIAATHDFHPIRDTADRVVMLDNGRLVEILESSKNQLGSQFILERLYGK